MTQTSTAVRPCDGTTFQTAMGWGWHCSCGRKGRGHFQPTAARARGSWSLHARANARAVSRLPQLNWDQDFARTDHGTYTIQMEHTRGERTYHTLWYSPAGRDGFEDLGPGRDPYDWQRAGTKYEVKALAREHHRRQLAETTA